MCVQRSKEGVGSPGAGLTSSWVLSDLVLGIELQPSLKEQQVLLATEASLQLFIPNPKRHNRLCPRVMCKHSLGIMVPVSGTRSLAT